MGITACVVASTPILLFCNTTSTIQHLILLSILLTLHPCLTTLTHLKHTFTLSLLGIWNFTLSPKLKRPCLFQRTQYIPEVNDDFSCWLSLKQAPLYSTRLLNSTCINTVGLQFNPHICYCPTHWKLFDKFTIYLHSFHLINSIHAKFLHKLDLGTCIGKVRGAIV